MRMHSYYNGCDGAGKQCTNANCPEAFHVTDDYGAQVQCTANDVSSSSIILSYVRR